MNFATALLGLLEKLASLLTIYINNKRTKKEQKTSKEVSSQVSKELENPTETVGYYFVETNKKVFIRKNGNGVIVCSFKLFVKDPTKVYFFTRGLNISDAKRSVQFQKFKNVSSGQRKKTPFLDQIFWVQSDNDIISKVTEDYSKPEEKADVRYIELKFHVNHDKLEPDKSYLVTYGYSIPGLYPIKDGKIDMEELPYSDYTYSSHMSVMHLAQTLKFSVYFERGIMLNDCPCATLVPLRTPLQPQMPSPIRKCCDYRDNIIYKKYWLNVDHPEQYEEIAIHWDLQGGKMSQKGASRS